MLRNLSAAKYMVWLIVTWSCLNGSAAQQVGEVLPAWAEGTLDIHQINTGKGNAAFFILPDGTTLLVDAGALGKPTLRHVAARPDGSRRPGEWICRYIRAVHPRGSEGSLDYALLTHLHGDHMGTIEDDSPPSKRGPYRLSGITDVGDGIAIHTLLDRGWPDYDYPTPVRDRTVENYRRFLKWQIENGGMQVERFQPGRNDQIRLRYAAQRYPNFEIRNIASNGEIWTGVGTNTRRHFPPLAQLAPQELPDENPCSNGFRLSYGGFDYFSGGDIRGIPNPGEPAWIDVETPVAMVVGPVEVSVLDHHGYIDSQNTCFVRTLQPQVWILPVWDSAHPTPSVYARLRSTRLYSGPRDIFATNMHPANLQVTPGLDELASRQGHILVRVGSDTRTFQVLILDDSAETFIVKAVFGPYPTR